MYRGTGASTKAVATRLRVVRVAALALLAALVLATVGAGSASAAISHVWVKNFSVAGASNAIPQAVDANGNILFYDNNNNTVVRTDSEGNPVPFSALESDVIDGEGGNDCPNTPADCDKVPTGSFTGNTSTNYILVAVDNSSGPASGDIYVVNPVGNPWEEVRNGQIEVFAPTGKFIGEIDQIQAQPINCPQPTGNLAGCEYSGISVDKNGLIYIFDSHWPLNHIERWVPIDETPADDHFLGELQTNNYDREGHGYGETTANVPLPCALDFGVATADYTYCGSGAGPPRPDWRKYQPSEYQRPANQESVPMSFLPDLGPFGPSGGHDSSCNCPEQAYADQSTQHMFVIGNNYEIAIQEWDKDNHRVGPAFGGGHIGGAGREGIAVDGSNGPNRGSIYVRSNGSQIAMFGPPVTVPDISYGPSVVGHTTASLNGTISLAGGTNVQECKIEYGLTTSYGTSTPCDQPTPYSNETDVSAQLSSLYIEATYHYRIVVTNALAGNYGTDQTFRTHAVLDAKTEPATNITMSSAELNGSLDPDGMSTQYHFQWGTTQLYGHETETADAGSGSGDVSMAPQTISNLQSGRTYHYRLVAENSLGTTFGPDATVNAARTPAIDGVYTTSVGETSADLNARINPSGFDTSYRFEYGTTPGYGSVAPSQRRRHRFWRSRSDRDRSYCRPRLRGDLSLPCGRDEPMGDHRRRRHDLRLLPTKLPERPRAAAGKCQLPPGLPGLRARLAG